MIKLYGIRNCRSCDNARKWLKVAELEFEFVDLREDGVDQAQIQRWLETHGADKLINKKSLTWREMNDRDKAVCADDPAAVLGKYPTLFKRPILDADETSIVGFSIVEYEAAHISGMNKNDA